MNQIKLDAVDKLIEKYSNSTYQGGGAVDCPLCSVYSGVHCNDKEHKSRCPNIEFGDEGCLIRNAKFTFLSFNEVENYPALKEMWSSYRELVIEEKDRKGSLLRIANKMKQNLIKKNG